MQEGVDGLRETHWVYRKIWRQGKEILRITVKERAVSEHLKKKGCDNRENYYYERLQVIRQKK